MILLRHGQTIFNVVYGSQRVDPGVPDPILTPSGREQAATAAKSLETAGITRVVASPYTRALETAEIIARLLRVEIEVEPLIRERSAFSCDVGTTRSELSRQWRGLSFAHLEETWWHPPPEPVATLAERCRRFCAAMARREAWSSAVVVTHWGVIHAMTGLRLQNGEMVRMDPTVPPAFPAAGTGPVPHILP
jgi:glucosyl-3-phosphoglycerate phosphatase